MGVNKIVERFFILSSTDVKRIDEQRGFRQPIEHIVKVDDPSFNSDGSSPF